MDTDMTGRITVVTGASRGVGLGIARELGRAGATVYVTGRSRPGATTDDLPGTVQGAARAVTEAGGTGIPVVCDHTEDDQVEALARRVDEEQGHVDLLVNNVWGGYEAYDRDHFYLPVWEQPVWRWDKMIRTGVRAHYTASRALLPLLLKSDRPLLVCISAGDRGRFLGDVQYDVAKAAVNRLIFALARRHRRDSLVAVAIHPGFTRTERVEAEYDAADMDREARDADYATMHSPEYVGRAVLALAADPEVMERSGGVFRAGDLGADYGFTDTDGRVIEPFDLPDDL